MMDIKEHATGYKRRARQVQLESTQFKARTSQLTGDASGGETGGGRDRRCDKQDKNINHHKG
jgi:hypothetical protein